MTAALRIVRSPPSPPSWEQRCFDFLPLVVVVVVGGGKRPRVCKAPHPAPEQLELATYRPRAPKPRRVTALREYVAAPMLAGAGHKASAALRARAYVPRQSIAGAKPRSLGGGKLTRSEQAQMEEDIAELRAAGVYDQVPSCYQPVFAGFGIAANPDVPPAEGPCGFASCRHSLVVDVDPAAGVVKLSFPDKDIDELRETCAMRVAKKVPDGETMLQEEVGALLNLSYARISLIETEASRKMKLRMAALMAVPPEDE